MDKIDHGTQGNMTQFGIFESDDMRVLNILVEQVQGLMPVSGNAEELGLAE